MITDRIRFHSVLLPLLINSQKDEVILRHFNQFARNVEAVTSTIFLYVSILYQFFPTVQYCLLIDSLNETNQSDNWERAVNFSQLGPLRWWCLSRRLKLKLPFRGMNLNAVNEMMVMDGIYLWSVYINWLKTFVAWSSFLLFLPSTCILSTRTSWHRLRMTSVVREGTSRSDWNCDNCHTTSHLYG